MSKEVTRVGKLELVDRISEKTGYTKKDIAAIIEAEQACIIDAMKKGESVVLVGYGTYKVQKVKAKKGRNIQTKEEIKIPAHKRVKFTPGTKLSEAVYKKKAK